MKIRMMGSPDLIEAWAVELKKAYGVTGRVYPCRGGNNEVRLFVDLDDRKAAALVGLGDTIKAGDAGKEIRKRGD